MPPVKTAYAKAAGPSFAYAFYVDLLAGSSEERTQNAVRHLSEIAEVRVLGCYPVDGVLLGAAHMPYHFRIVSGLCAVLLSGEHMV